MASSQPENGYAGSAARLLLKSIIPAILCAGSVVCAQAQQYAHPAPTGDTSKTSTETSQTAVANTDPTRTTETHTTSGNQTVDKKRTEILGANSEYQPNAETEKETVQVDATTTRTVERTYQWDVDGHRNLVKVTEEDARGSANGDGHVVSTTSNVDDEGNVHVVQREVADTKKTGADAQETKTTIYVVDGNGGLIPNVQTQELQKTNADKSVEVTKTTLVPTSTDHWGVQEVRESTITKDGDTRTSDVRIMEADSEGRLSEVSRTVAKDTDTAAGGKVSTVETYSTDVSGITPDGSLHLSRKVMTVQGGESGGGKTTVQEVQQPKPGDPLTGLQVTTTTKYIVQYGGSNEQQAKATQMRDVNGNFNTVDVETQQSTQPPPATPPAPPAPTDKPK
jgi:hypothetical protein